MGKGTNIIPTDKCIHKWSKQFLPTGDVHNKRDAGRLPTSQDMFDSSTEKSIRRIVRRARPIGVMLKIEFSPPQFLIQKY